MRFFSTQLLISTLALWAAPSEKVSFNRYIRLPFHGTEGHKTLSNWYTTLLNAYGNPIKHYGDLDLVMQRNRIEQTGANSRFLA